MIKSATGILLVAIIALLTQGNLGDSYILKGNFIRYPEYLHLFGTVSEVLNPGHSIGYWRGFTRIEASSTKLLFAYAMTNQHKRFLTMYAAMSHSSNYIHITVVNNKMQKIGYGWIALN